MSDSVTKNIEDLAEQEVFSVAHFLASAASGKLAVMLTIDYLKREAGAGRREDFEKYPASVAAAPPMSGNEL